ncbi:MAG: hypothetical protein SFV51_13075 [Bryobacteraceae bacterium]|nr:hypothetical protein [Bryobacteraceae bacterium]
MIARNLMGGARRAITSLLLAATLLLPHLGSLLFAGPQVECSRNCCRTKKSCCCRKSPDRGHDGPAVSARNCLPGCSRISAPPTGPQYLSNGVLQVLRVGIAAAPLVLPAGAAAGAVLLSFALFGRPPPAAVTGGNPL